MRQGPYQLALLLGGEFAQHSAEIPLSGGTCSRGTGEAGAGGSNPSRSTKLPYRGEPPAQLHSPTSIAAAEKIKKAIGPLHTVILSHLRNCPDGATDEEMQDALRMAANTQRPRRRELQLMGLVRDSGKNRLVKSGRSAVVWRIVP